MVYPPHLYAYNPTIIQFQRLFAAGGGVFFQYCINTFVMTVSTICIVLSFGILCSYGISILPFKGSKFLFLLILSVFMVPFQSLMVPLYSQLTKMHLFNTKLGIILIYSTFFMPFCIFMLKNSFQQIPKALKESATIDGATNFTILRNIYIPLSGPSVVSCIVYLFIETWNDFILSFVFSSSDRVRTIQVGIMNFGKQRFQSDWGIINSGTFISILPTIILFLFLQKYYVQGLTIGAVKE
jgi:multiple sugar transport system permease protein